MSIVGTTISHYQVESELGRGGMGVVYKAIDTTLGRTVALKFLPPMVSADEHTEARFINEAKAVSALDHPNIAVVHEIDRSDDGQLFIVMAYYEGETLEDKIVGGPFDIEDVADIATQMASGLQRAHEKGIIHRDIKPGNVMVTAHGLVKILDFGLAKMQNSTLTMAGTSLGTLSYMSPEQAQGQPVDNRTDLWAVGVVLFEMLTGSRPFDGPYDAAILYAAANEQHQSVLELREEIPEYLAEIVDRLLEKSPDKRFQSADELLSALKSQDESRGTTVSAPETQSDTSGATGDSSTEAVAAAAPAAAPATPSPASTSITVNFPSFSGKRKTQQIGIGIGVLIIAAGLSYWALKPENTSSDQGSGASAQESAATNQTLENARAAKSRGEDHLGRQQYSLAQAELERALEYDSTYSAAWSSLAAVHVQVGDFESAISASNSAIHFDSTNASGYFNLGYALQDKGSLDEAIEAYTDAVKWDARFVPAYSAWGNALIEDKRELEALQILERGRVAGPEDPAIYFIYRNMGRAHLALKDYDQAILFLESAVQLQPTITDGIALLAESYEADGQTDKSREAWVQYLEHETDPIRRNAAQQKIAGK